MEKDKLKKKRNSDLKDLPLPEPPPPPPPLTLPAKQQNQKQHQNYYKFTPLSGTKSNYPSLNLNQDNQCLPDAFKRLLEYKDRESTFLKTLNEAIAMDCKKLKNESTTSTVSAGINISNENKNIQSAPSSSSSASASAIKSPSDNEIKSNNNNNNDCELLKAECENFIMPLLNRTGPSISAALVAYDAFEQLNRLHGLLDQMLTIQEQNYQMRRYIRDVNLISDLKKLQKKGSNELLIEADNVSDTEHDLENQLSILSTILAAGNSATTKRNSSKRQRERSKSVMADDIQMFTDKGNNKLNMQRRRQSALCDTSTSKAKVSKWTKVKAAFKWERANVPALIEGKSSDSGIGGIMTPMNAEVARYLRVPSVPCTGSSADSVLSSSSGHLLSCGGSIPATPGTISSASSTEDFGVVSEDTRHNRDSSKSDSRCDSRINEEETRRSRSLDGDATISPSIIGQKKDKTTWRKVKDIIQTHRGSFKGKSRSRSIKSNESITYSRDVSPCESLETDRTESTTSPHISPLQKNLPTLSIPSSDLLINNNNQQLNDANLLENQPPSSPISPTVSNVNRDEIDSKNLKLTLKGPRKSKVLSDFESLPEGVVVDLKTNYNKLPPSPLNLSGRQDLSDIENIADISYSSIVLPKSPNRIGKPKRNLQIGNNSVPSSPSRNSEFFGEFESEELSSGDFSEPCSPQRKLSPKSNWQCQQDEINEKYLELKQKLNQEFELKRQEWEKIQKACCSPTSCAFHFISRDESSTKSNPSKSLEENLSADFKKKLHKWRVKKQVLGTTSIVKESQTSPTKENESKKIDWNLWKTGQLKLEGQGLQALPEQKDLPEEFQKKLEQWKKMKETNSVPAYNNQDSLKRKTGSNIKSESSKKNFKDEIDKDKQKDREKSKHHERDKLEKLSKLKAIVADPRAKEIEVQTSKGIMKFEGISRKFTRKLYEWEKARGIGPEMSTFALLHPGYRPLDVGNGAEENKIREGSPPLGRSLSLDSISPNASMPQISHQPSSLSLNDMDDLIDTSNIDDRKTSSNPELNGQSQQDEPEAVIVEVEDDIIETAAPLMTAIPIIEQQTPIYKYEASCSETCARKNETIVQRIATYSLPNNMSSITLQNVQNLDNYLQNDKESYMKIVKHVQSVLSSLKNSLPELERCTREGSPHGQNALEVAKKLIEEIVGMMNALNEDDEADKESLSSKAIAINNKLRTLQKSIDLVCKYIEIRKTKSNDQIPEINVTSDDGIDKSVAIVSTTPTVFQSQVIINQPKILMGSPPNFESSNSLNVSQNDIFEPSTSSKKMIRNVSNGSKKKMRLRKMGSRQNSKTESDSTTSDEDASNIILEAPRRIKRKTSRGKKMPEEERKIEEKKDDQYGGEDVVYVLKIKPGQIIEQTEKINEINNDSNILMSPIETCVQLMEMKNMDASEENLTNVFVKTKRKLYTAVEEPAGESKIAIARDLDSSSSTSDRNDKANLDLEKSKLVLKALPPLPQSPGNQRKSDNKVTQPKEPSPCIRMMIAKYNQKIEIDQTSCISSIPKKSPILDRRVLEQKIKYEVDHIVKSASAGNIRHNGKLVPIQMPLENKENRDNSKLQKSSSAGILPSYKYPIQSKISVIQTVEEATVDHVLSLACDSLQKISKNFTPLQEPVEKKEHLYRKNKEKPTSLFSKTGAIRKIGTKNAKAEFVWRRCLSNTYDNPLNQIPDKSDNTIPKITRKLEGKTVTEESKKIQRPYVSAPTTPSEETVWSRPKTPLSERALKLQKAKEEFLRSAPKVFKYPEMTTESMKTNIKNNLTDNDVWKKRLSQVSNDSDSSNEECTLSKSASVGLIGTGGDGDNEHSGGYVSLPRNVSRSGKIISKFGFSTLASKFRKVKMRRTSRDGLSSNSNSIGSGGGSSGGAKMNTVSALCRQSLAIDIMPSTSSLSSVAADQQYNGGNKNNCENSNIKNQNIINKSGSTQTISFGTLFRKNDKKSKSAGTVLGIDKFRK